MTAKLFINDELLSALLKGSFANATPDEQIAALLADCEGNPAAALERCVHLNHEGVPAVLEAVDAAPAAEQGAVLIEGLTALLPRRVAKSIDPFASMSSALSKGTNRGRGKAPLRKHPAFSVSWAVEVLTELRAVFDEGDEGEGPTDADRFANDVLKAVYEEANYTAARRIHVAYPRQREAMRATAEGARVLLDTLGPEALATPLGRAIEVAMGVDVPDLRERLRVLSELADAEAAKVPRKEYALPHGDLAAAVFAIGGGLLNWPAVASEHMGGRPNRFQHALGLALELLTGNASASARVAIRAFKQPKNLPDGYSHG